MNINIFNGYQSTEPAIIKFRQMVDIIRGDKQLAELTKRYRITHQREVSIRSTPYCKSQNNVVTLHGGIIFPILKQKYAV